MTKTMAEMNIPAFEKSLTEFIGDKENNETIDQMIKKYISKFTIHSVVSNPQFIEVLLKSFIKESLIKEESPNRFVVDHKKLSQRSQLLKSYIHRYLEYQLNFLLVLYSIGAHLGLSDELTNNIIYILHENDAITREAYNHWHKCFGDIAAKVNAIQNVSKLIFWLQESREEIFFDSLQSQYNQNE